MTDDPVDLDRHRGMAAQKSTEIRRRLHGVKADQTATRERREEFEKNLFAAPSANFTELATRVRYLLQMFAASHEAKDPRQQRLIADVLEDLARLTD